MEEVKQCGFAVAVHRVKQGLAGALAEVEGVEERMEVAEMAQREAHIGQAGALDCTHGEREHLCIGRRVGSADELDARLPEFALHARLRVGVAEDAAGVAEALGHWQVVQAGGHQAGDRYGHIGAQGQRAAVAIDKAVEFGLKLGVGALLKRLHILKGGGQHIAVSPATEERKDV